MKDKNYFDLPQTVPICAGTGLLALDLVINQEQKSPPKLSTGGSCGNVLTILSYLGWEAYPIARLASDIAEQEIRADLKRFNVKLDFIESDASGSTPIIIEQIRTKSDGTPTHSFRLVCPNCGKYFPRYKPVLVQKSRQIAGKMPDIKTFYFDKVSAGAIDIAQVMRNQGAMIVFEPSSIGNQSQFEKALSTCHIFKYAGDRLGHFNELEEAFSPVLQIETLGNKGLRYRRRVASTPEQEWQIMPAFKVDKLRDAAGCGDWCTAGIIHLLGRDGSAKLESASNKEIHNALQFGQALAALNCYFEGPRGGMYALTKQEFQQAIAKILKGSKMELYGTDSLSKENYNILSHICPNCPSNISRDIIVTNKNQEIPRIYSN